MARSDQQMHIKVPPDMREFLVEQTKKYGSSLNSEIIRAIRERMDRIAAAGSSPRKANPAAQSQPAAETAVSSTANTKDEGYDRY